MGQAGPVRGTSRRVESPQTGPHERLEELVQKHLAHPARGPIPDHTRQAYARLTSLLAEDPTRPLVLDAGCGTGESTARLALRHPEAWVVGVDQSAHRLARAPAPCFSDEASSVPGRANSADRSVPSPPSMPGARRLGERVLLLRAELGAFYRILAEAGLRLEAHYLLYPNPYPKPRHLTRRWSAHPAFAYILQLGGLLELRSNWLIYVEEWARAIEIAGGAYRPPSRFVPNESVISPFERKYHRSGHPLYAWTGELSQESFRPRL